jgi:threonylcarbamoyladenosine tRNA methylthiotransferase MtaB
MPHAAIGSDLIVGFPGETDDEFSATELLLRDLPLSHVHVFPYSDRPGTEASVMSGKVDGATIRERGSRLRALGREMSASFRRAQQGTTRRALTVDDGRSAVTDNYVKVQLDRQYARNEWIDVTIE